MGGDKSLLEIWKYLIEVMAESKGEGKVKAKYSAQKKATDRFFYFLFLFFIYQRHLLFETEAGSHI